MPRKNARLKICGIYAILNTVTGETYVGSSREIMQRFRQHWSFLHRNTHKHRKLREAVQEFGCEAFTFVVLEECTQEDRLSREKFWIDYLCPEYNLALESTNSPKGVVHTLETRMKMSEARRNISDETRNKMAAAKLGHVKSLETRLKLSTNIRLAYAEGRRNGSEIIRKGWETRRNRATI